MALRQANSAGSTATALKRSSVSCSSRTSAATWLALPLGTEAACSCAWKSGLASRGMHHCTAFSRNSSAHDSSSRITCTGNVPCLRRTVSHRPKPSLRTHLVAEGQTREGRQVLCPLDGHEEQPGGGLVNCLVHGRVQRRGLRRPRRNRGSHRPHGTHGAPQRGRKSLLVRHVDAVLWKQAATSSLAKKRPRANQTHEWIGELWAMETRGR